LGRVTCREIEIERGGQISGDLSAIGGDGGLPDRDTRRHRRMQ
jgi:cytoskeletal protein CcmA (bactofilin family)